MTRLLRFVSPLFALDLVCSAPAWALGIRYTVVPEPPHDGTPAVTHVTIHLSSAKAERTVRLQMPVWSPGDYHVQNHGKYIFNFRATTNGDRALMTSRPDS